MNPTDVETGLRAINNSLGRILTGSYSGVLDEAIAQVRPVADIWKKGSKIWQKRGTAWGYQILRERPLEFQACDVKGYSTMVDLSCALRWPKDPAAEPIEQNITLRVWSLEKRLCFRREWDAELVEDMLEGLGKRVILRVHFDLANSGQPGPKYHLQVGGIPASNELYWFPSCMNLPRFAHPPTDIVLICELIASSFFPEQYRTIRTDPIWRGAVRDTQRSVLQDYFHQCHDTVASGHHDQSLLDQLWNEASQ